MRPISFVADAEREREKGHLVDDCNANCLRRRAVLDDHQNNHEERNSAMTSAQSKQIEGNSFLARVKSDRLATASETWVLAPTHAVVV